MDYSSDENFHRSVLGYGESRYQNQNSVGLLNIPEILAFEYHLNRYHSQGLAVLPCRSMLPHLFGKQKSQVSDCPYLVFIHLIMGTTPKVDPYNTVCLIASVGSSSKVHIR